MAAATLGAIGALISLYLLLYNLRVAASIACPSRGCEAVNRSAYARLAGLPVAAIGLAGYVAIASVAIAGLFGRTLAGVSIAGWLLGLTTGGLAFSGYLTYVEIAILRAVCAWCAASAALIATLFVLAALDARRSAGPNAIARPPPPGRRGTPRAPRPLRRSGLMPRR